MNRVSRQLLRDDRGQALVEFALIVPVFLLLLIGAVDFGRAFNYKNNVTSLANSAARYAEVNSCIPCGGMSIESYVASTAESELRTGSGGGFGVVRAVDVSFCFPAGTSHDEGDPVKATVSAEYAWLPYLHLGNVTISSSVTVRLASAWTDPAGGNAFLRGGAQTCAS